MSETTTTSVPIDPLVVPVNPDGTIGALPERLQKFLDERIAAVVARRRDPAPDPLERETLRQIQEENQRYKVAEAEREKKYDEALALRDKAAQEKHDRLQVEIDKRTKRITEGLQAEIRAAALAAGARPEAVADVAAILASRVTISEDLLPVVLDDKGQRSDLSVETLVKQTLDAKQWFRAAPSPGGGARGGASLSGGSVNTEVAALQDAVTEAQARLSEDPRSNEALAAVLAASRALRAAQQR